MCQRALGNVGAAFWNVPQDSVTWTGAGRAIHMSSPFGARGFCRDCGTPLSFHYVDSPNIDLAVGALDDPGAVRLTSHFGVESRSEERRVGKEWVSTGRSRWWPYQ